MSTVSIGGVVNGAFGDMEDCEAFLELQPNGALAITPEAGGTFIKFAGCTYLFKGLPKSEMVDGLSMAKATLFFLPREIILRDWLFIVSLGLRYLLSRKKFWFRCNIFLEMVYNRTLAKNSLLPNQYNRFVKELKRAAHVALGQEFGVEDFMKNFISRNVINDVKIAQASFLYKSVELICFFLESDSAYRFRSQDALETTNKQAGVRKAVSGLFDTLITREDPKIGLASKWRALKRITLAVLWVLPSFERVAETFLRELDLDKIKLDESDWYFCLRRKQYMFRGWSLEKRLAEKQRIDDERGHWKFKLLKTEAGETKVVSCYDENFARRVADFRKELEPLTKKYGVTTASLAQLLNGRVTTSPTLQELSTTQKAESLL